MTLFALVDCNNFYASCERVFNPALEGKPIVVLSNNDGCIIARSNEAKKLGIPMGAPFFKWEHFCRTHHVSVFSSNYELYGDMSRRVMSLLKQNCSDVEIYSIDEAFLLVEGFSEQKLLEYALSLRKKIKLGTGLPVSIGIGSTKTLAKIANALAKNHTTSGVYYLNTKNMFVLKEFPVEKIWGIGRSLAEKLHHLQFHTAEDLQRAEPKLLRQYFSVNMEKIIYELRGESCLSLESIQPRKQIISSRSFGKLITTLSELEEAISYYTSIAAAKLRSQHSLASGISVFVHTNYFHKKEGHYENSQFFPFAIPTCDTGHMIRIAKKGIQHLYRKGCTYQKAGVILIGLTAHTVRQMDFFDTQSEKTTSLMKTVDAINQAFGHNTIFHCAEGIDQSWQIKSARRSPRYTTRWEEIVLVR